MPKIAKYWIVYKGDKKRVIEASNRTKARKAVAVIIGQRTLSGIEATPACCQSPCCRRQAIYKVALPGWEGSCRALDEVLRRDREWLPGRDRTDPRGMLLCGTHRDRFQMSIEGRVRELEDRLDRLEYGED